jgi:hypothetical protein
MRTVELLDEALRVCSSMGYQIRHEWLGGSSGGACEFGGRRWLFVDLALRIDEQLEQVVEALRGDPAIYLQPISGDLARLLDIRRAA